MKNKFKKLITFFLIILIQVPVFAANVDNTKIKWFKDSPGFEEISRKYEDSDIPVLVFFHADWCGYCSKFIKNVLEKEKTASYLREFPSLIIVPDNGMAEEEIASDFGVSGYPSFYVFRLKSDRRIKITGVSAMTPDSFINVIESYITDWRKNNKETIPEIKSQPKFIRKKTGKYELLGTVGKMAIMVTPDGKTFNVKKGDFIKSYKIIDIDKNAVTLVGPAGKKYMIKK